MAPMTAEITSTSALKTSALTAEASNNPLVMVLATAWPVRAPMKLKAADIRIARPGLSTRVEMTVAMALAVSWKPFMKSKLTARTRTRARSVQPDAPRSGRSGMFDRQAPQHVGYVLGPIGDLFHLLVYVSPLDEVHHVGGV